jgi:5'-nucleotidase
MRILITNDDGVASEGLWALARRVVSTGHEAVVVAPVEDMTGMGAALGGDFNSGDIEFRRVERDDLGDTPCFAVEGPPALCVILTQLGAFGDPVNIVASGVNPGANCGRSTLHSGTVGAALTAANNGAHGIAVSQDHDGADYHWDTATHLVPELIERLAGVEHGRRAVNVNAPNVALADIAGVSEAKLAKWGDSSGQIEAVSEGKLRFVRQQGVRDPIPGSDHAAVRDGYIAVTELIGVRTTEPSHLFGGLESFLG